MNGIQYPVSISKIKKFEKQNQITVNVFGYEDKEIFPLHVTKIRESTHHVNLLYVKEGKTSHYCLITNLNRFLSRAKTQSNETHFCNFCYKVLPDKIYYKLSFSVVLNMIFNTLNYLGQVKTF